MTSERLAQALRSATDTREILLGEHLLDQAGELFTRSLPGRTALLVADETTWRLAGPAVMRSLQQAGVEVLEPLVLPGTPPVYAGYENVVLVRERLAATGAHACSIGSGTLNDLTKLASGELSRPYVHVCTACSMDGYAAFGAAITRDGFKITRTCPAPAALLADLAVMATAPATMTANGYGDMMEKFPGGADWLVADAIGVEALDEHTWQMVQSPLRAAMSQPEALAHGDRAALAALTEESMLSGLAIQAHQSSRPGSGAGHNFSHQWEMEGHGLDWEPPLSHGAKVGIGTVAVCALYDRALELDLSTLDVEALVAAWPDPQQNRERVLALHDVDVIAEAAVTQSMAKYLPADQLADRIGRIQQEWPALVPRLREQLVTADQAAAMLRQVGAAWHPEQIDISLERLRRTYYQAQTIRSRYTIMDVLFEVGLFGTLVEELFSPDGYWGRHPHPEA
ncbi:sn-glycerol-1-phosphate dehydrogenase [Luteococcus peritonei]|uniref:Sn-glycerol-1-phosphate dehydrogenase n=1 Tax=Luteococcus peritonei TaxID=88874 RepID=A0ABW4RXX0_9ACTN